jgi:1-acyl-sn-glycerol-3-phosphate acyltransferase
MGYIRTFLAIVYVILYMIVGIVLMPVVWLLGRISPRAKENFVYRWVYWGLSCEYHICGSRVNVVGRENIPKGEGAMFVSNHRSIFDLIITLPILGVHVAPIAKIELRKIPFLHFWMRQINCIFLDRKDIKAGVAMITEAVEDVKRGLSVIIYPEGTRNKEEGTLLPFHGGSFKIAIRSGAPVIPITCIGTGDIFEDHFPRVDAKAVTIVIGEPIPTKDMSIQERKELPRRCETIIRDTLQLYAHHAG